MRDYNPADFIVRFPGVYDEKEKAGLEIFWKEANAINNRGPIDIKALIEGKLSKENTPGFAAVLPVTEGMIKYNHAKYEQENPIYNDKEAAKKAGYLDIPAYRTFGAHDDTYTKAFPESARDTLLVSQACHKVDNYCEVYAGDTLYLFIDERTMIDITPAEGSVYRSAALRNSGTIYNQRGEIVNKVSFHYVESVKTYKPELRPADFGSKGFADIWEDPDWFAKEDHYYTDADYEEMKKIWAKEEIRGAEARYWEDVQIGDTPAQNLEGPLIESALPAAPYGHGIGGTRTMKKEIMDPETFSTMTQNAHGIYVLPDAAAYTPEIPDGARPAFMIDDGREEELNAKLDAEAPAAEEIDTSDIHGAAGDERAAIINFYGRDLATHHLNNWMGDAGRLESIYWSIMAPETHEACGKTVPVSPMFTQYLSECPLTKDRKMTTHGLTRDLAKISSQVVAKYVKNGKYIAKLVWWVEDYNNEIWLNGEAEVSLPHR